MGRQETETGGWSEVPEPAVIPLARQAKPAQAKPRIRKSSWGTRTRPLTVIARSPCDEAIQGPRAVAPGLLRCARNDDGFDAAASPKLRGGPRASPFVPKRSSMRRRNRGRVRPKARPLPPAPPLTAAARL